MEYMHKCRGGHSPVAGIDCLSRSCPENYTCELKKFCCPTQREGMCPMTRENAICVERLRCNTDMDCATNMKCCDQGCLYKTCTMRGMICFNSPPHIFRHVQTHRILQVRN